MISKLLKYFHTVRHLKIKQIFFRLKKFFFKPKFFLTKTPNRRKLIGIWKKSIINSNCIADNGSFNFLNEEGFLKNNTSWNDKKKEKLWLYNLHYFDYINSNTHNLSHDKSLDLMHRWVIENPPLIGVGWDPYPSSLRIVNWIQWSLNGNEIDQPIMDSLHAQAHILMQDIEYHILGNHIFANAKALIFYGLYFQGSFPEKCLMRGLKILDEEIDEQILFDGGHFERSTMYHSIISKDLLDLINLSNAFFHIEVGSHVNLWKENALKMIDWMISMLHPDNEIAFFNDAAFNIAPKPLIIIDYAKSLGISSNKKYPKNDLEFVNLESSGYSIIKSSEMTAILDCAPLGPEYLLGHSHADTLSFEFSLFNSRVFINSGTSCYGLSEQRLRERGTAFHNTVEVNQKNSSEVWSGFRVARRAKPFDFKYKKYSQNELSVSCKHNGYHNTFRKITHERQWKFQDKKMIISDRLRGKYNSAKAYFYLHPSINVVIKENNAHLTLTNDQKLKVSFEGGLISLNDSQWFPEFGKKVYSNVLILDFNKSKSITTVDWS
tara:strand:- start:2029 stop:3675 length:1647 start_codon:yes stop_codon:yes gene_type:complete